MTRRKELEEMNPVKLYDLMLEYNIPVCKREEAINRILDIEKEKAKIYPEKIVKSKIQAARLKAGLSQAELSKLANLNIRTLQAYEQSYKNFDNAKLKTILKVVVACKCKLEDIIEDNEILELYNMSNLK